MSKGTRKNMTVTKRTYIAPKLYEYGRLVDLTHAKSGIRTDYGGGSIQTFFVPDDRSK